MSKTCVCECSPEVRKGWASGATTTFRYGCARTPPLLGGSVHPPDPKQRVTERQQHRGAWKNRGVLIKSCTRTPIQKLRGTKGMLACKRVNNNTAWCSAHSVTWLRLGAWRLKRNLNSGALCLVLVACCIALALGGKCTAQRICAGCK